MIIRKYCFKNQVKLIETVNCKCKGQLLFALYKVEKGLAYYQTQLERISSLTNKVTFLCGLFMQLSSGKVFWFSYILASKTCTRLLLLKPLIENVFNSWGAHIPPIDTPKLHKCEVCCLCLILWVARMNSQITFKLPSTTIPLMPYATCMSWRAF